MRSAHHGAVTDRYSLPPKKFLKHITYNDIQLSKEVKLEYGGSLERFIADMSDRIKTMPCIWKIRHNCEVDKVWAEKVLAYNCKYNLDLVSIILESAKEQLTQRISTRTR